MLLKIAWRNLWRNKRRSLIILTSIAVGVAAILLYDTLLRGMIVQMVKNQVSTDISHIQVHKKGFNDNRNVKNYIPDWQIVDKALSEAAFVEHYSKRVSFEGMISSANVSWNANINGIEPSEEKNVTIINSLMWKGDYLDGEGNQILIGKKMAEKLEVELGGKVVLMAADIEGSINSQLFRVAGIFRSGNSEFDKINVYIPLDSAQSLVGLYGKVNEFAMVTNDESQTIGYSDKLEQALGDKYEVLPYQEILPLLVSYMDLFKQTSKIFYLIIIVGVLFGVINTMLMSVFERVQEFGVLMSIGMKNRKIFMMVIQEAFVLSIVGTLAGFALGLLALWPIWDGLDLAVFSASLESFGIGTVIYPILEADMIVNALIMMPVATIIAAMYPARKAIKLQPTEAMRYV